jgi:hypothetical protein
MLEARVRSGWKDQVQEAVLLNFAQTLIDDMIDDTDFLFGQANEPVYRIKYRFGKFKWV